MVANQDSDLTFLPSNLDPFLKTSEKVGTLVGTLTLTLAVTINSFTVSFQVPGEWWQGVKGQTTQLAGNMFPDKSSRGQGKGGKRWQKTSHSTW